MHLPGLVIVMLLSAAVVVKGADWFVEGAVWIARRMGISELVCGATIVSFGTTLPETAVSSYASWSGHPELALGNALGSCLANGALILGLSAVLAGFTPAGVEFRRRCLQVLLVIGVIFGITRYGFIGRPGALLLLLIMVWATVGAWRGPHAAGAGETESPQPDSNAGASQLPRLLAGAVLIALGSRVLVASATQLAVSLGVSESVIGLTLVAIGTSLPELATAVTACARAHGQLALGNVLGANFLNLTLVLGLAGAIRPIPVDPVARSLYLPFVALLTLALLLLAKWRSGFGRLEGALLLGAYVLYLASLWP